MNRSVAWKLRLLSTVRVLSNMQAGNCLWIADEWWRNTTRNAISISSRSESVTCPAGVYICREKGPSSWRCSVWAIVALTQPVSIPMQTFREQASLTHYSRECLFWGYCLSHVMARSIVVWNSNFALYWSAIWNKLRCKDIPLFSWASRRDSADSGFPRLFIVTDISLEFASQGR